jgi:hypothetical protein
MDLRLCDAVIWLRQMPRQKDEGMLARPGEGEARHNANGTACLSRRGSLASASRTISIVPTALEKRTTYGDSNDDAAAKRDYPSSAGRTLCLTRHIAAWASHAISLEQRPLINRVHACWLYQAAEGFSAAKDYLKFIPDRRPHASRQLSRTVHPCCYHSYYSHSRPSRQRVTILKEAWIVKIERHSPRAMKNIAEQTTDAQK